MWKSPDGKLFSYPAAATLYQMSQDLEMEQYIRGYAPQTYQWLRWLERTHGMHRCTRFDQFLGALLRRQGYVQVEAA